MSEYNWYGSKLKCGSTELNVAVGLGGGMRSAILV